MLEHSYNKRIVKNTLFLYIRMIFIMGVSLFTSRVVLDKLGVTDYGIYNTVGGVVAMLAFLNSTLSTGTSRFLTFELGKDDIKKLKATFCTTFYAHAILAIVLVVVMETIGLWFVYNHLIIPSERISATLCTYHISIFTMALSITQVPYTSVIIAHENMKVYAYLGIFEAFAKLLIVYLLVISTFDKLIFYACLIAVVQFSIIIFYRVFCVKHYKESILSLTFDKKIFREILSFSSLSLIANLSQMLSSQGLVVLINMFFQPAIVAAQAIGTQLTNAMMQFVSNLQTAITPQVIKLYAQKEYNKSRQLTLQSSVYIHELVLLLSLPAIVVMDPLLHLWLVEVPPYAIVFAQYIVLQQILGVYNNTLYIPMIASGKLASNSKACIWIGIGMFAILYSLLKWGCDVMWVQYICILQVMIYSYIVKPYILCKEIGFSWSDVWSSFCQCLKVSVIPIIISVVCAQFEIHSMVELIIIVFAICLSVLVSSYIFLDKDVRNKVHTIIRNRIVCLK